MSRVLLRSLPASLPPTAAAQLTTLASAWLAVAPGDSDAAPAVQLQAEAAHLLLAMFSTARVKLPAAGARQLLQQVCRLCQHPPRPLASVAAAELACGCADLLAQLPQWYPQPPKLELAAAATAVAAVLDQQTAGGSGAPLQETSATTRLLCKLLRALQVLLAEVSCRRRPGRPAECHFALSLCEAPAHSPTLDIPSYASPCPAGQEGAWGQRSQPGGLPAAPVHVRLAATWQRQRQQHAASSHQHHRCCALCTVNWSAAAVASPCAPACSSTGGRHRRWQARTRLSRQVSPPACPWQHTRGAIPSFS